MRGSIWTSMWPKSTGKVRISVAGSEVGVRLGVDVQNNPWQRVSPRSRFRRTDGILNQAEERQPRTCKARREKWSKKETKSGKEIKIRIQISKKITYQIRVPGEDFGEGGDGERGKPIARSRRSPFPCCLQAIAALRATPRDHLGPGQESDSDSDSDQTNSEPHHR